VAAELAILSGAAAASGVAFLALRRRVAVPPAVRRAVVLGLGAGAVALALALVIAYGGPRTIVRNAWDEFRQPAPAITSEPSSRLFDLSSLARYQQWEIAGQMFQEHPWLGAGAGGYERYWDRHRPVELTVRDAHNLYLETLAELGPLGLAALLLSLGAPIVAALRSRATDLVPAALGAYVAYLAHAGIDWDWEMPAVTLAALTCAGAILLPAGERTSILSAPARLALGFAVIVLGAGAVVTVVGNGSRAASAAAIADSKWDQAEEEARKAARWAPWSSRPWQLLAQAKLAQGDRPQARKAFRRALAENASDWELWIGLAGVSAGAERARALSEAARLNPYVRGQDAR
jgi:tetratricopeptide (TPR) repeat protein